MPDDPNSVSKVIRSGGSTDADDSENPRKYRGNSRAYLIQRLREAGHHDLIDKIERRQISARAAAVGLGWVTEVPPSTVNSRTHRRLFARTQAFGGPQPSRIAILGELWLGPNPTGSIFNSREELIAA